MDGEALLGTDPLNADTDGDGISDGGEVVAGTDPNDPPPVPALPPLGAAILMAPLLGLAQRRRGVRLRD